MILFVAANVGIMVFLGSWETIPFMAAIFVGVTWHARRHRAALEELRHTRYERDFIRDASHQLRIPITVARGHAEFILEAHPRSPVAADVRVIAGELQRLSMLSDRLLMLAAAEEPSFVNPRPVDIGALVESTITRWKPVASRRWRARVTGGCGGTVLVDRERVECALDALIENAVNATGEGDLIEIAASTEGDATTIDVIDEGAGISPGDIQRIFGHFSRADNGGPGRNGGTGLGLPVAKAIAEAHGGSVTVWSEPKKGTTFRLRLNGAPDSSPHSQGGTRSPARPSTQCPPASSGA